MQDACASSVWSAQISSSWRFPTLCCMWCSIWYVSVLDMHSDSKCTWKAHVRFVFPFHAEMFPKTDSKSWLHALSLLSFYAQWVNKISRSPRDTACAQSLSCPCFAWTWTGFLVDIHCPLLSNTQHANSLPCVHALILVHAKKMKMVHFTTDVKCCLAVKVRYGFFWHTLQGWAGVVCVWGYSLRWVCYPLWQLSAWHFL